MFVSRSKRNEAINIGDVMLHTYGLSPPRCLVIYVVVLKLDVMDAPRIYALHHRQQQAVDGRSVSLGKVLSTADEFNTIIQYDEHLFCIDFAWEYYAPSEHDKQTIPIRDLVNSSTNAPFSPSERPCKHHLKKTKKEKNKDISGL